ncbi:MAG: glycogen debranching N-terminal domain-containing protein [Chloroflexia bacterium]
MSALSEQLVLKEGDLFLVTDETGDVKGHTALGLYYQDTRFLSHLTFDLNDQQPELLNYSSSLNFLGTLQFANRVFKLENGTLILKQTVSIRRTRFISEGLHDRFVFTNYNRFPVALNMKLTFGADFRDIFDLRGFARKKWGRRKAPVWQDGVLTLGYESMDEIERQTIITFDSQPDSVRITVPESDEPIVEPVMVAPLPGEPAFNTVLPTPLAEMAWRFVLQPNTPVALEVQITPNSGSQSSVPTEATRTSPISSPMSQKVGSNFDRALEMMRNSYAHWESEGTEVITDHEYFNKLLARSKSDLRVLSQVEDDGYFPAAGIPWFTCPFGRDSLITSLQALTLNPKIAVGTLRTIARYQGQREDPWREEQPGKILHELRRGELAHLNMVPHSPYYGSVDATPLFVMLFVETMNWLDDDKLFDDLLPNVWRAIEWIDRYGDVDGDGFVEYVAATHAGGIRNQVWKDSGDSTQFPDHTLAETPIAAVEVQGYVYAAKKGLAELLRRKGDPTSGERLEQEAEALKRAFNQAFWLPQSGFYTQGLDKDKRPVPTITSNPGHCLWTGIVDEDKAALAVERMMQPDMTSGWGIRTISGQSTSYNPMSYHNGSIWPHDNSLVVAGFKRYGFHDAANKIITQVVEAARHFQYARLPELYCGFQRDLVNMSGPAEYPVSCSPQAWAAAAPILMLQSILGLQVDAYKRSVKVNAHLPEWLNRVELSNLRVGNERASLLVERGAHGLHVVTLAKDTNLHLEEG